MTKLKIFEIVLSAITSLIVIAKSLIKLIQHLGKLRQRPKEVAV